VPKPFFRNLRRSDLYCVLSAFVSSVEFPYRLMASSSIIPISSGSLNSFMAQSRPAKQKEASLLMIMACNRERS